MTALGAPAAEDVSQALGDDLSLSAASGLRDLHPEPLRSTPLDGMRRCDRRWLHHVRATLAEGKVHTHCFPGARVCAHVSAQIPTILKDDESIAAVVLHAGVDDIKQRQTEQHVLTPNSSHMDAWSGPFGVTFWCTGYPFSLIFRCTGSSIALNKKLLASIWWRERYWEL